MIIVIILVFLIQVAIRQVRIVAVIVGEEIRND